MSTDRETTRVVRSWLDEGVTKLPDRVLDAVLDQVPATPQRRSGWSAWRSYRMSSYLKIAAAAAAVIILAVAGYQLLPRNGGIGGQPTAPPSPTPSVLANGTFSFLGFNTTLDATRAGSSVSGSLHATGTGTFTVDLQCERTVDGELWIGGDVTESGYPTAPKGTRAAIVLKPGTPVRAVYYFQSDDPPSASCGAFLDGAVVLGGAGDRLVPVTGTVTLNP